MTPTQREYVTLYEKGYGVCEIARMLGKSRSAVSTGIKNAYKPKQSKSISEITVCEFSKSCFSCPLPDCRVASKFVSVNLLPIDFDYVKAAEKEAGTG